MDKPSSLVLDERDKLDRITSLPFIAIHLLALGAFFVKFHWYYPVVALGLYYIRMFGITAGYHRYFAHRSYKMGRVTQFLMAVLGCTSAQKGVLWWAAHHRDHHKYSDQPEDIHSPVQRGFWWSHVGWILASRYHETKHERIRDFGKYPELRWLNKYHLVPPAALAAILGLIGGVPLMIWFCVSTVVLWHGTFTINSLSHVFGSRRYQTTDDSRNNLLLALITCGEGWHNNHHYYMSTANQGFFWWEIDFSYYALKMMSWLGLVWDLRTPPKHIRDAHLVPKPAVAAAPVAAPIVAPVPSVAEVA
jgi:stearoyl-CoA desaturase (delta-9 desaturase)